MKKLAFTLASIILLASCSKEDVMPMPEPMPVNPPVNQIKTFADTLAMFNLKEYTDVPDPVFEQILVNYKIDNTIDGKIKTIDAVRSKLGLEILHQKNLISLKGLEAFINTPWINLWDAPLLKSINLSNNLKLQWVAVSDTDIENVDISKNISLKEIDFQNSYEQRSSDPATIGQKIWGFTKGLTSIDLTNNINLEKIHIAGNRIKTINVSHLSKLSELWINDCPNIERLELTNLTNLNVMVAYRCDLNYVNLKGAFTNLSSGIARTCLVNENPRLRKVLVDDPAACYAKVAQNMYWWNLDPQASYVTQ